MSKHGLPMLAAALVLSTASGLGASAEEFKPLITRDDLPLKPHIMQISIRVADIERADAFYTKVLGMRLKTRYEPSLGIAERFYGFDDERSATNIALVSIKAQPAARGVGGMNAPVSFNLVVSDVTAITDKVVAGGGKILRGPITHKAGPFTQDMAFIADPDGTTIELVRFY